MNSSIHPFKSSITDGAYKALIQRITSNTNPDFLLLNYSDIKKSVTDLTYIPGAFFTPEAITARKPLPLKDHRAGWQGSEINLTKIPVQGKVALIVKGIETNEALVHKLVSNALLLSTNDLNNRGWLFDILNIINSFKNDEFTVQDVYQYRSLLAKIHQNNHHIDNKIRQQLQFLRQKGFLQSEQEGHYKRVVID